MWLVKLKRYTSGESILLRCDTKEEAEEARDSYNESTQAKQAYIEEWDPAKI